MTAKRKIPFDLQRTLRTEHNLTDSIKELLDTGKIIKTFVFDTIPIPVNVLYLSQTIERISAYDITGS